MTRAQVVLTRVVGAVGEPEADQGGPDLARDRDAFAAVVEGAPADGLVRAADAAEAVGVVAEQVRVDRTDAEAAFPGVGAQRRVVVDGVPGDVEGDARAAAGEPVDERRVRDPFPHVARRARPGIDVEARSRVAVPPARRLDLERPQAREHVVVAHGASA